MKHLDEYQHGYYTINIDGVSVDLEKNVYGDDTYIVDLSFVIDYGYSAFATSIQDLATIRAQIAKRIDNTFDLDFCITGVSQPRSLTQINLITRFYEKVKDMLLSIRKELIEYK